MKKVFICNDSMEGIFSALYDAWKISINQEAVGIAIKSKMEQELFCEYEETKEGDNKIKAVIKLIKNHLGMEVYLHIYQALLSTDAEKGNAILGTMLEARNIVQSHRIMEHLSNEYVRKVFELSRYVGHEAHLFTGFVRFKELENGVLFSKISPKNNILTCIADHFEDRLPMENWMIYDETYNMYLVHQEKSHWAIITGDMKTEDKILKFSAKEMQYEQLWKGFCNSISIENRKNVNRQKQHMPGRYRKNMVEFQ